MCIRDRNKAMDYFVFDSSCKKIVLPLPLVFKSGYVNTHEKIRASGRNFDISSSISCTEQADGSITVNQFGYAGMKLDYKDLLYENADISIWAKIKNNSEANEAVSYKHLDVYKRQPRRTELLQISGDMRTVKW